MKIALFALILFGFLSILLVPVQAQECGDGVCNATLGESSDTCPADCGTPDPCAGVSCEPSFIICPDGFQVSCENSCSQGVCASCTPSCVGHDALDPCAGVTCSPNTVTCADGSPSSCDNSCAEGICSSCEPFCGSFCGDGVCQDTEFPDTCPEDCGSAPADYCGDGFCTIDTGENTVSCPQDCGVGFICGDGVCEPGEEGVCPEDCGIEPYCGDGFCTSETGENPDTCRHDCGQVCPASIVCSDGIEVACSSVAGGCECNCPLPPECYEETDVNGIIHVFCDEPNRCPEFPPDVVRQCLDEGGRPETSTDPNGCEVFSCTFQEERTNPFGSSPSCPSPEQVDDHLRSCTDLGLEGSVIFEGDCRVATCTRVQDRCGETYELYQQRVNECYAKDGYPHTGYDNNGCEITTCEEREFFCERSIPDEAYKRCDLEGGEFIVQQNHDGCIEFAECVRRGNNDDVFFGRVTEVPDTARLLVLAFKLEDLALQFDQLSRKAEDMADYYQSVGSLDEGRFRRIVSMFRDAKDVVNQIKNDLRDNLDNLNVGDMENFKRGIAELRATLKDILYVMLSSSDEAKQRLDHGQEFEAAHFDEFDRAFRVCESASFNPDSSVIVSLHGIDDEGRCILRAKVIDAPGVDISMECRVPNFSQGMDVAEGGQGGQGGPGPETMDRWNCVGTMADGIRSGIMGGPDGGPGGGIPPEAEAIMRELGCNDQFSCGQACSKPENWDTCRRLASFFGGGPEGPDDFEQRDFNDPRGDFGPDDFGRDDFGQPGGGVCSGCLNNGVCDPGECSDCRDCRGGF